jgi:hypothetical protein
MQNFDYTLDFKTIDSYLFWMRECQQKLCKLVTNHESRIYIMASQRQIQDKRESTQEDSLGIKDAQKVEIDKAEEKPKKAEKSHKSADSDSANDNEPAQKLELLSQLLKGELSAILHGRGSANDPNAALKAIDEMHGLLQKLKQPEAKEIATMLKELQKLLKQKEPTGHELGELIGHLGEKRLRSRLNPNPH